MRLAYYRTRGGNFGDDLNPWLWPQVLPEGFLDQDPSAAFVGIGTLLNRRFEANSLRDARVRHVFGSGAGYGDPIDVADGWRVHFVRGAQTAALLGLPPARAVTDPAILVADAKLPAARPGPRFAFMPHHAGAGLAPWPLLCRLAGLRYIDPRWSVERVLGELRGIEALGAEAMHGAIVADALRVPWLPVFLHEHIAPAKWVDWADTLGATVDPVRLDRPVPISGGYWKGGLGRLQLPGALRRIRARLEAGAATLSGDSRHRTVLQATRRAVATGVAAARQRQKA